MTLFCATGKLAAVCAGTAQMEHIDTEVLRLACELAPKIQAIADEGEITLKVKHGWVRSIGTFVVDLRKKFKTVD